MGLRTVTGWCEAELSFAVVCEALVFLEMVLPGVSCLDCRPAQEGVFERSADTQTPLAPVVTWDRQHLNNVIVHGLFSNTGLN
ncbi:unnamed protein product [Schistocephalus solidus]|uniref:Secreted protein n=1 Tax=Schistocephalus solidus TaxID=70667 RepID=A0A183SFK4_SCHSO|nr:unnamed protein product [Schistocephalus solidus]